jgi:hypothetical protein
MAFNIVDYSEVFFVDLEEGEIPRQRDGKFVLITNHHDVFAVFSPRGLSYYHANIVERFLLLQGIHGQYNVKRDVFYPNSSDWHVMGGGLWQVNEDEGILRVYGHSQAYGGVDLQAFAENMRDAGGINRAEYVVVGQSG